MFTIVDTSAYPSKLIDSLMEPVLVDDEIQLPEMEKVELRKE